MDLLREAETCLKIVHQVGSSDRVREQVERSPAGASVSLTQLIAFLRERTLARDVFLGVLKSFSVTPKERKGLEAGARFFNVSRGVRIAMPRTDWMEKYLEYLQKIEGMFTLAIAVITRGEACTANQFCTARCFRLVNTGHFPQTTMQAVQKVVDHAAELLDRHGFGMLCYGDMNVTQTVARNKNILAFYTPNNDEMHIRANLKGVEGAALHTIVHEVGHRLEHRFMMREFHGDVARIYRGYERKLGSVDMPSFRELVEHDGEQWAYNPRTIGGGRSDGRLEFINKKDLDERKPNARAIRVSIEWWMKKRGIVDPFPSDYSKKTSSEFLAEMFAFYIADRMTPEQKHDFAPLIDRIRIHATHKARGGTASGMTRGQTVRAAIQGRRV